jgi:hypothetical protein
MDKFNFTISLTTTTATTTTITATTTTTITITTTTYHVRVNLYVMSLFNAGADKIITTRVSHYFNIYIVPQN